MSEKIRIILIDRHQLFREGIRLILDTNESFQDVIVRDRFDKLQEVLAHSDFDIILIDINIFMENHEELKNILHDKDTKVIVLADQGEEYIVTDAIKTNPHVHGFLMREMEKASFIQAIQIVKDGPTVKRIAHFLTKRERSILQLLTYGQSNQQIAETLDISIKTVKNHVSSILKKMEVNDRTQAAVMAIRNHWVQF